MKITKHTVTGAAALLSLSLVLLLPATSAADKQVNSGEILLISDEILGHSVEIERLGGNAPPGNGAPGAAAPGAPTLSTSGGGGVGGPDDALASTSPSGNDVSRSGFGDGSNDGLGSGNNQSGNEGTGNPGQGSEHRGR